MGIRRNAYASHGWKGKHFDYLITKTILSRIVFNFHAANRLEKGKSSVGEEKGWG